jgi:hypothetical protein
MKDPMRKSDPYLERRLNRDPLGGAYHGSEAAVAPLDLN